MAEKGKQTITRRLALAGAVLVLGFGAASAQTSVSPPVPPIPPHIAAAVASPERNAEMTDRDPGRKPAEVFAIAGLKAADKVIEIGSFGQYDSTIIANAVGSSGKLYMYDLPYLEARQAAASAAFVTAHPWAEYKVGKFDTLSFPAGVDMVVIDMYYHDLALTSNGVDMTVFNKKMFDALRPGGRLLIVDHLAEPGSGRRDSQRFHRIDKATILSEVQAAGFKLLVDSNLFANPADKHDVMVFNPTARGGTDRALLVFEKPL